MSSRDPRVDAYIQKSGDFARPILTHLRDTIHSAAAADETIKWGVPFFMYNGRILCSMAAFKHHCGLHFWNGSKIVDAEMISDDAMGQFGRITKVSDLPPKKVLVGYVKKAVALHDETATAPPAKKTKKEKPPIPMPASFSAALKKNGKAQTSFENMSPSHRREYLEWITGAKTDTTRDKRIATAIEWIGEGKGRNWKYEKR